MYLKNKILILDDNPEVLNSLSMFLEKASYKVCTVTSSEMLYVELKRFKPNLIVLDVYIKGVDEGRKICKIIKSEVSTSHIPVILMSVSSKGLENYKECEADAIIGKPFSIAMLTEQIKALVVDIGKDVYIGGN
ncbi:MAG: response regulator [Chitinophagaceae bacterium]